MFRKNERHRQQSFLTGVEWMPEKLRQGISDSWAGAFREQVFCRIDEELFVDLYSEEISRPNTPVNVLVSAEILKSGFGWSDEEVHEQVCYNLLVRHALGLADLRAEDLHAAYVVQFSAPRTGVRRDQWSQLDATGL